MRNPTSSLIRWLAPLLALGLALAPAAAAPPDVPGEIAYQGSLFDDVGAPRTGVIDLTVRLYDAAFAGTLLYKQEYLATPLTDGVFTITLGPVGLASDTPTNPLTTSLIDVFEGDLAGTAPGRFLQLTVGLDGPLGRTPILASPFAMRASVADNALSADTATNVVQLGAFPVEAFTEFYEHTNLDNSGPGNTDPAEGVADVDGDGIANFIDPDNDGDGLSDSTEVSQGSDMNLVTPQIFQYQPPSGIVNETDLVTVLGTNFQAGLTVVFGSENPTPVNVTATSFDVSVADAPEGIRAVQVTNPNGESDADSYEFFVFSENHSVGVAANGGLNLYLGDGAADPVVSGRNEYAVERNGSPGVDPVNLLSNGGPVVAWGPGNVLHGLRCRDTAPSCVVEMLRDDSADRALGGTEVIATLETLGSGSFRRPDLEFDASGHAVAAYLEGGGTRQPRLARDLDGDGDFDGVGELVVIPGTGFALAASLDLALSPTGNVAFAFYNGAGGQTRLYFDRNGDGDFDDTVGGNPETLDIATGNADCTGLGFDPSGRLALVSGNLGESTDLWRDLSADGDFDDAGEITQLAATGGAGCDAAGGPGGLAVVFHDGTNPQGLADRNDDGDFADPGETVTLSPTVNSGSELAVSHTAAGETWAASSFVSSGKIFGNW